MATNDITKDGCILTSSSSVGTLTGVELDTGDLLLTELPEELYTEHTYNTALTSLYDAMYVRSATCEFPNDAHLHVRGPTAYDLTYLYKEPDLREVDGLWTFEDISAALLQRRLSFRGTRRRVPGLLVVIILACPRGKG